jgi:LPXTG-site transpeptidase (sortase) family protein
MGAMPNIQYEDWFWGTEGGDLDPEGLHPDGEGWAAAAARPTPVLAPGAVTTPPARPRGWGPVDASTLERPASRADRRRVARERAAQDGARPATVAGLFSGHPLRGRLALVAGVLAVVAIAAGLLLQPGVRGGPGFTASSSVVDPGADLAMIQAASIKVAAAPEVPAGPRPPGRLIIRSIGVDAPVVAVGVDKEGNMAVTNQSYDVGWYNRGPSPGDTGDAVLDGHLDWYDTSQAVFYNLKNVKQGDDIEVQRTDGVTHHFKVTGVKSVAYNASVPGLFATTGPPRISLITCGGQWSRSLNQYVSRVIVDATMTS